MAQAIGAPAAAQAQTKPVLAVPGTTAPLLPLKAAALRQGGHHVLEELPGWYNIVKHRHR
jgi:hypothetical protein